MYRTPPPPIGHANDVSTPTIITMNDGATTRIAFPCFYAYRKDGRLMPYHRMLPMVQDHYGWPQPNRPDHSFQPQLIDPLVVEPIHLEVEGYVEAFFVMNLGGVDGVDAMAEIDDSVIRVYIECGIGWGLTEPLDIPFALFITTDFDDPDADYRARDVVTTGILRVLPPFGNLETGE